MSCISSTGRQLANINPEAFIYVDETYEIKINYRNFKKNVWLSLKILYSIDQILSNALVISGCSENEVEFKSKYSNYVN